MKLKFNEVQFLVGDKECFMDIKNKSMSGLSFLDSVSFNYKSPRLWYFTIPIVDKFYVVGYNSCDKVDNLVEASEYVYNKFNG